VGIPCRYHLHAVAHAAKLATTSEKHMPTPDLMPILDFLAEKVAERIRMSGSISPGTRPRLMSVKAAAEYLGRTQAAIRHMVQSAKLPCVRADRRILMDVRDLDRWIENHKSGSDGSE